MKLTHLLIILILIFASTNVAVASWPAYVGEISYQVENTDRIIVGNVTDIQQYYDHNIVTIEVDEWLMNPLPSKVITVRTETFYANQPKFTENETVILMLKDVNVSDSRFEVRWGDVGKHPISDKEAIEREIAKPDIPLLELAGVLAALVTVYLIYDWYKKR